MGYTQVEAGENVGWDISGFVLYVFIIMLKT